MYNGYNPSVTQILKAAPVREKNIPLLADKCQQLVAKGIVPSLKVILVGNHPPSLIYTRNKKKFIEKIGAECEIIHLDENISEVDLCKKIDSIGADDSVHGCFVQLPLPKHLHHIDVKQLIPANKDVDGFHQDNMMMLLEGDKGEKALLPCTPKGIITLMENYQLDISGKTAVVMGEV